MSLVVEDGTGLPDAESYVSVAELRTYATRRGQQLPADDSGCEALLIQAVDFLQTLRWKGSKTTTTQRLKWPRQDVWTDDYGPIDKNTIPQELKDAQCTLAIIAQTIPLMPNAQANSKGGIQSESVYGAVARTYFKSSLAESRPYLPQVNSLLSDLLEGGLGIGVCVAIRT